MATALIISAVAIYYSVAGLVAIFAGAAIPIIIMGSALEIGKLVTAVWLHRYWKQAKWWLKTYLSISVAVLMLITSMGIFGFLSKAHIEQTTVVKENLAQIEQIESEITRQQTLITDAETRITQIQNQGSSLDERIQEQIDTEQRRIDTAYERVQPEIDRQQRIIDQELANSSVSVFTEQIEQLRQSLTDLDAALASGDVARAQTIVGTEPDGALGPATTAAIEQYRNATQTQINELQERVAELRNQPNPTVDAARAEINRLRARAESVIDDSNALISRLRAQLGTTDRTELDTAIHQQREVISTATDTIQQLTGEKFELESLYRGLEAEVGPIKYIAEFIYSDQTDAELLEKAVRWVIVVIIFVFDPLAVLLLIASQYTFQIHADRKKNTITDKSYDTKEALNETKEQNVEIHTNDDEQTGTPILAERGGKDGEVDQPETPAVDQTNNNTTTAEPETVPTEPPTVNPQPPKIQSLGVSDDYIRSYVEKLPPEQSTEDVQNKKKDTESLEKLAKERELEIYESTPQAENDKTAWKKDHPDATLKHYKTLYLLGQIDKLPWEGYAEKSKEQSMGGYKQNGEQSGSSLFNKIKRGTND